MYHRSGRLCLVVLAVAVAWLAPGRSWAGTGTMVPGPPHYVNLNLYYTYNEGDLAIMRNAFQEASRLMFNATNGQIRFGTVRVSKNSVFQNRADVWVNSGAGGAYTSVGGLGAPGWHTTLFVDRHRWTNEDGPLHNERGQFGIVHEFGHYIFNLYDEYDVGGAYPGASCVSMSSTIGCAMDGGTTVHPNHHRTEWCTPAGGGLTSSHVTSPNTPQQALHGQACWQTLANYCAAQYGVAVTIPTTVQTGDPAGLGKIGWVVVGDRLRFVITLDRSGSMGVDNKLTLAKQGATLFVDLCKPDVGESIAVVSFSNKAVSNFPMRNVTTSPNTKAAAIQAINSIALENMTALGDGLRTSLNEITGGGAVPADAAAAEAIVLLSDGVHNFGSQTPAAVLPDLKARGARVFTIGLGSPTHPTYPLDEATLMNVANETGGTYRRAPNATDLSTIYADFAAEIRGMDAAPEAAGELKWGLGGQHEVFVDSFTTEQTFVLHWPFGSKAFEMALRRPDGTMITRTTPAVGFAEKDNHIIFRIRNPQPGSWKIVVTAKTRAAFEKGSVGYKTQAFALSPGLSCTTAPRRAFYDKAGQTVVLRASVAARGVPVAKAQVSGVVRRPDGKSVNVVLYDDGNLKEHGDDKASDGIYSARFADTQGPGTYQVDLVIRNVKGVTATPDEIDPKWKPTPVAPFTRTAKTSFSIGRQQVKPPKTERPN